jgi:DNA-binding MarR family transcriptional regulator
LRVNPHDGPDPDVSLQLRVYTCIVTSACICSIIRLASRRISAIYDAALESTGVSVAQFSLLRHIAALEPANLGSIARAAELERSTIGRNLRVLERMELVAMTPGEDQRNALVSLTKKGRKVLREAEPLWDACQDTVADRLGASLLQEIEEKLQGF